MNADSIAREALTLLMNVCRISERELVAGFDNTTTRYEFSLPKRSGGWRLIVAPHHSEKLIQSRLLSRFFTRMLKRHNYYWLPLETHFGYQGNEDEKLSRRIEYEKDRVCHQQAVRPLFSNYIHGGRLRRNVRTALLSHTHFKTPYVMKFDLTDAFGSVPVSELRRILTRILSDEAESYYQAYAKRLELVELMEKRRQEQEKARHKIEPFLPLSMPDMLGNEEEMERWFEWEGQVQRTIDRMGLSEILEPRDFYADASFEANLGKLTKSNYPKYALFPANACSSLRKLIREAVVDKKPLSETGVPEILETFLGYVLEFVTHEGVLPQGFPTSSILLNLVISDKRLLERLRWCDPRIEEVSIYVDDIVVTYNHKPDDFAVRNIEQVIDASGIFRPNRKKTRRYDLRVGSVDILGMKLNRRPAVGDEPERINAMNGKHETIRGRIRAERYHRPWMKTFLTLPKRKQKTYRGLLRRLVLANQPKEQLASELAVANGYLGHIVLAYGWPVMFMPASLRKVVQAFREKYHTPVLLRKRWNDDKPRTNSR